MNLPRKNVVMITIIVMAKCSEIIVRGFSFLAFAM